MRQFAHEIEILWFFVLFFLVKIHLECRHRQSHIPHSQHFSFSAHQFRVWNCVAVAAVRLINAFLFSSFLRFNFIFLFRILHKISTISVAARLSVNKYRRRRRRGLPSSEWRGTVIMFAIRRQLVDSHMLELPESARGIDAVHCVTHGEREKERILSQQQQQQ